MAVTAFLIAPTLAAQALFPILESVGWNVEFADLNAGALAMAARAEPDLILLDARRDVDLGAQLCRSLRSVDGIERVPIFTMAGEKADDRLMLLESGADDCWTEAHDDREFLLRLRAIDRRLSPIKSDHVLRLHGIELNSDRYTVRANGAPVQLTAMQLKVLKYFMEHPGIAFSRRELLENVWENPHLDEGAVTACIVRIRRALAAAGTANAIRNIRSTGGYLLELEASAVATR